jgi:hypothetical protein
VSTPLGPTSCSADEPHIPGDATSISPTIPALLARERQHLQLIDEYRGHSADPTDLTDSLQGSLEA